MAKTHPIGDGPCTQGVVIVVHQDDRYLMIRRPWEYLLAGRGVSSAVRSKRVSRNLRPSCASSRRKSGAWSDQSAKSGSIGGLMVNYYYTGG